MYPSYEAITMSYSLSFKVRKDFDKEEVALKLQKELDSDRLLLAKNCVTVEKTSVLMEKDIPYGSKIENTIGINLHCLSDAESDYFNHKIMSFSKEYGVAQIYGKLKDDKNKYPYYYFDDERIFILPNDRFNEVWKDESYEKSKLKITYQDRFSKPDSIKSRNICRFLLSNFLEKEINIIKKTLNII